MSVRKAMAAKPGATAGQRNRSESPAPNQADIAGVASAGRRAGVSVALCIGQWDALDNVAPNRMGAQLAALLIHRHAPQTPRAAAELIDRLGTQGQHHGPLSDSSLLLRIDLWVMLREHVAAMLRAGYGPREASLPL